MAVDIKVAPDEKLELVKTYITDTNPNSDYFVISELPDTFSGGKNAFLIAGSDKLLGNTEIKVQIRDAAGNVVYHEYSAGSIPFFDTSTQSYLTGSYYEGNSKVVAVYVYPNVTAFGPATITILAQAKDVPAQWEGLFNVKWTGRTNINPALANTTRVRFYKRPQVQIKELLQPLYTIVSGSKVASLVTQSFASITVNQLETFAGDVARVKVFRTSAGDISDYELIQDISVEAKNLLTTYALSGSVVGNAGIFGPDSLSKVWNTGSLSANFTSAYVNDGLELTGSGYLTYTSSLNLLSSNTYELELDSYFTGSPSNNLGIYVSYPTQSLLGQPYTASTTIATISGSTPTKNFGTQTFPFTIPFDYPSASLYFSQSSGTGSQWHIGNISLNLTQDTAFSPNEVSFVTSMPTVLGNETFNFKFEFYDVNNNYVPVGVTASALFNGGNNNIGGTLLIVSSSTSASNAYTSASILALSQSVSGTIGVVTGSVSQSFYTASIYSASLQSSSLYISSSVSGTISNVSQSVSGTISSVSQSLSSSISSSISTSISYTSQSVYNGLSSSYAKVQQLADGGYSGSFISGNVMYAPVVGGQLGYFSSLFRVGQEPNSIYLDARTSTRKIYIGGVNSTGSYNSGSTSVYMDSAGQFSLGTKLKYDGSGTLVVTGQINIEAGGNAATTTDTSNAVASGSLYASNAATSASALSSRIFTDTTGLINKAPTPTGAGLYLGSSYMGYYNASAWKTYISSSGDFYLSGTNGYLQWNAGADSLSIKGNITATTGYIGTAAAGFAINSSYIANGKSSLTDGNAGVYIGTDGISLGASSAFLVTSAGALTANSVTITGGSIQIGSKFSVGSDGTLTSTNGNFSGTITAAAGTIGGWSLDTNRIYVPGAISFNSSTKAITIYDTNGVPATIMNQNASFSPLGGTYANPSSGTPGAFSSTTTAASSPTTYIRGGGAIVTNAIVTTAGHTYKFAMTEPGPGSGGQTAITITTGGTIYHLDVSFSYYLRNSTSGQIVYVMTDGASGTGNVRSVTWNASNLTISGQVTIAGDGTSWDLYQVSSWTYSGTSSATGGNILFPAFTWLATELSSFTEIIAGGIQTGYDTTHYVKLNKLGSGTGGNVMLEVGGEISATGNITAYSASDKRLKENIISIENAINKLNKINGVEFDWKPGFEKIHSAQGHDVGLIAQEIEEVLPEVVTIRENGYMAVKYEKVIPLLIQAIKELSFEIEELKKNK